MVSLVNFEDCPQRIGERMLCPRKTPDSKFIAAGLQTGSWSTNSRDTGFWDGVPDFTVLNQNPKQAAEKLMEEVFSFSVFNVRTPKRPDF